MSSSAKKIREDEEPVKPKSDEKPAPKGRRCRDDIETILKHAAAPSVPLTLGGAELITLRPGAIALLIGATGGGKTSLAVSMLIDHAQRRGPAIGVSLELPADEFSGRAVGIGAGAAWMSVLTGQLSPGSMLAALPERLFRISRDDASMVALATEIDVRRQEYPGEPVLVAVDYVQLVGADSDEDARPRIGRVMRDLDRTVRSGQAVCVALSQGSRASSRGLSSGERIGADTTDAGAEASDLERWASATLAIGAKHQAERLANGEIVEIQDKDNVVRTEIHVGKYRMGVGDTVIPARYYGATGRWELAGDARPAAEVKVERAEAKDAAAVDRAALTIMGFVAKSTAPATRTELEKAAGIKAAFGRAAVSRLLESGELVEVKQRRPRSSKWLLWAPDKAREAGIPLAGDGVTL